MKYIIDGYNMIHKMSQLRGKALRTQREGLIAFLERAQEKEERLKDLTVVFDGRRDILPYPAHSNVKVIFARGTDADAKIGQMIESSSFARDIAVVSDDRRVRSYAGRHKAKKISVKEFLKKLSSSCAKKDAFKLGGAEAVKINQELERLWLNK
ncbi:MAG: NYN domain-containing protein [Candidatus Omnitrophota bacterium]|nr:MAG: NYN domain-containing protein [Candidatus Omnitrophota bacterium]